MPLGERENGWIAKIFWSAFIGRVHDSQSAFCEITRRHARAPDNRSHKMDHQRINRKPTGRKTSQHVRRASGAYSHDPSFLPSPDPSPLSICSSPFCNPRPSLRSETCAACPSLFGPLLKQGKKGAVQWQRHLACPAFPSIPSSPLALFLAFSADRKIG